MSTAARAWLTKRRAHDRPRSPAVAASAAPPPEPEREPPPSEGELRLDELAAAFVVKANFTYGGGSATIATLHSDIVERHQATNSAGSPARSSRCSQRRFRSSR